MTMIAPIFSVLIMKDDTQDSSVIFIVLNMRIRIYILLR